MPYNRFNIGNVTLGNGTRHYTGLVKTLCRGQTTSHAAIRQGDLISIGIPSPYPSNRIFMTLILSLSLALTADSQLAYLR